MAFDNKRDILTEAANRRKASLERLTAISENPNLPKAPNLNVYTPEQEKAADAALADIQKAQDSWASFGELSSGWGQAKQMAAGAIQTGVNRSTQQLANFFDNSRSVQLTDRISDEAQAAHLKQQQHAQLIKESENITDPFKRAVVGKQIQELALTDAENALLDQKPTYYTDGRDPRKVTSDKTYREMIKERDQRAGAAAKRSDSIDESFQSLGLYNPLDTTKQELQSDLADTKAGYQSNLDTLTSAWDKGDAVGVASQIPAMVGMIAEGAGDLITNPAAVGQFTAESAPSTALGAIPYVGPALLAADNMGYGLETHRKNLIKFQENNGRLPSRDEASEMFTQNMLGAAAEHLSDRVMLGAKTGVGAVASKLKSKREPGPMYTDLVKASDTSNNLRFGDVSPSIAERNIINPLPQPRIKPTETNGLKPSNVGVPKAYMPPSAAAKLLAGAGAVGGRVAAGMVTEGATETYQTAVEEYLGNLNYDTDTWDGGKLFEAGMIGAGSGAAMGPMVAGISVAGKGALAIPKVVVEGHRAVTKKGNELKKAVIDRKEEIKARDELKAQAKQAVTTGDLKTVVDPQQKGFDIRTAMDTLRDRNSQEGVSQEERTNNAKTAGELFDQAFEKVNEAHSSLAAAKDEHAKQPTKHTEKAVNLAQEIYDDSTESISEASKAYRTLQESLTKEDKDSLMDQVSKSSERTDGLTIAAQKLITILANSEDVVAPEELEGAVSSSSLTESERTQIEAYITARKAESAYKGTKGVRKDIIEGGRGFMGIRQYRNFITSSLTTGNRDKAESARDMLASFTSQQTYKAKVLFAATEPYRRSALTGEELTISPKEQEAIDVAQGFTTLKGDSYTIDNRTIGFANRVREEAKLLNAALKEMDAYINGGTLGNTETYANTVSDPDLAFSPRSEAPARPEVTPTEAVDTTPETVEAISNEPLEFAPKPENKAKSKPSTQAPVNQETKPATQPSVQEKVEEEAVPVKEVTSQESRRKSEKAIESEVSERITKIQRELNTQGQLYREAAEILGIDPDSTDPIDIADAREREGYIREEREAELKELLDVRKAAREAVRSASYATKDVPTAAERVTTQTEANKAAVEQAADADKLYVVNAVQTGFKARSKSKSSIFQAVPNLLETLKVDPLVAKEYSKAMAELPDVHAEGIVEQFVEFAEHFGSEMDQLFKPREKGKYKDFIQWFADEDGNLSQDVKNAMAVTAYSFIANDARDTFFNDNKAIRSILSLSDDAPIPPEKAATLRWAGSSRSLLLTSLGSNFSGVMGISAKTTAPSNYQQNLEQAAAQYVLGYLLDNGYLDVNEVRLHSDVTYTPEQLAGMTAKKRRKAIQETRPEEFLRARFEEGEDGSVLMEGKAEEIRLMNQKTRNAFGELFGVNSFDVYPSLTAPTTVSESRQGTSQKISQTEREAIAKHQKEPQRISTDNDTVFMALTEEQQLRLEGFDPDVDSYTAYERDGVKGKNDTLKRELGNYKEYREYLIGKKQQLKTPFYFLHQVWKQGRIGMKGNKVNPQASKMHRSLVVPSKWSTMVSIADGSGMAMFDAGIAQALGVGIDKLTVEQARNELRDKLNQSEIKKGIAEIQKLLKGESADKDVIFAAAKAGGEGTHSLAGLTNYARMLNAVKEGATEFHSDIYIEMDGITNGVIIGAMLFSGASDAEGLASIKDILRKGGVFFNNDATYGKYKEAGNSDNYVSVGQRWSRFMKTFRDSHNTPEAIAALDAISNYVDLDDRGTSKQPLMTRVYGSGLAGIADELVTHLLDGMASTIRKAVANKELASEERQVILDQVKADYLTLTGEEIQADLEFNPKASEIASMKAIVLDSYGAEVKKAIDGTFESFMANRNLFNSAVNYASAVYAASRDKLIRERTEALGLPKHHALPTGEIRAIEAELLETSPVIKSLFSSRLDEGIFVGKTQKVYAEGDSRYLVETSFGKGISYRRIDDNGQVTDGSQKSMQSYGRITEIASPGVGGAIMSIHNFDASIAIKMMLEQSVLNVHDGFPVAATQLNSAEETANRAFYQHMVKADLMQQAVELVERASIAEKKYGVKTDVKKVIEKWQPRKEGQTKYNPEGKMRKSLQQLRPATALARQTRIGILNNVGKVHQYAAEGQGFIPRDKDRPIGTATEAERGDAQQAEYGTLVSQNSSHAYPVDNRIEAALNRVGDGTTLGEVVASLKAAKSVPSDRDTRMQDWVFDKAAELVPDVRIRVIQPSQMYLLPKSQREAFKNGTTGLFDSRSNEIILKSGAYQFHGMRSETLAHETMHALLSNAIRTENPTPEVQKLRDDLNSLLEAVKAKNADRILQAQAEGKNIDNLSYVYNVKGNELDNIDEFLVNAFTNPKFGRFLATVAVDKKKFGTRVKNALSAVADALFKYLAGSSKRKPPEGTMQALEAALNLGSQLAEASVQADKTTRQKQEAISRQILGTSNILGQLNRHGLSSTHIEHLRVLNDAMVNATGGMYDDKIQEVEDRLGDSEGVFLQALVDGKAPFSSGLLEAGFNLTPQESYMAEKVAATFNATLDKHNPAFNEMRRVWALARKTLTVDDFLPDGITPNDPTYSREYGYAKAQYDALFLSTPKEHAVYSPLAAKYVKEYSTDHLSRFAALAMTSEKFRKSLDKVNAAPDKVKLKSLSIAGALQYVWEKSLEIFNNWMLPSSKLPGSVAARADQLISDLARIEIRKKAALKRKDYVEGVIKTTGIDGILQDGRSKLLGLTKGAVSLLPNQNLRTIGRGAVELVTNEYVEAMFDVLFKVRNQMHKDRQGWLASTFTEMRGMTSSNKPFWQLLREANRDIDQKRAHTKEWTANIVRNAFHQTLSDSEEMALTESVIHTDMQSLLTTFSVGSLANILTDNAKRLAEIVKIEQQLKSMRDGNYYANQAKFLGEYMVTGISRSPLLIKNAQNIAWLGGTSRSAVESDATKAEALIDQLASLQAIGFVSTADRNIAAKVLRREQQNPNLNGVEALMLTHRKLIDEASTQIFDNNINMIKGYTPQITDPNVAVKLADRVEGAALIAQGYRPVKEVIPDSNDPVQSKLGLYVADHDGSTSFAASIMSLTSKKAMGTRLSDRYGALGIAKPGTAGRKAKAVVEQATQNEIADLFLKPVKGTEKPRLIPILVHAGGIQDYRYEMSNVDRKYLLKRNTRVSDVMGTQAATIVDKVESPKVNRKAVQALYDQFSAVRSPDYRDYVVLRENSEDAGVAEIYALLPEETKQDIRDIWGKDDMRIRKEHFDLLFGYRKVSVAGNWNTPETQRNFAQKAIILAFSELGGQRRAANFERGFQEIIRTVKDILVIKTGFTLAGNILSNLWLLGWSGLSPVAAMRDTAEGWTNAIQYQKDQRRIFEIEHELAIATQPNPNLRSELSDLKLSISRNPTKELIDAGLFQTIIEDVDSADDPFSYKSQLLGWADNKTERVPEFMKSAFKVATVSHDTALYKFLNQSTQISDFAARYAKFKHMTQQGIDKQTALDTVVEDFIYYDVPTHRGTQYLNDMGLAMFTKYLFRIQKPVLRLFREKPFRSVAMAMGHSAFDLTSPLDYAMGFEKTPFDVLYNPVSSAIGSPDEILPLNLALDAIGVK